MLYSRTEAAWLLSCRKLFRDYSPIYFWTFTFTEVLNDWVYPVRWERFTHDLVWKIYGGRLAGLRVIEIHKDHGLHYHALLNKRVWVRIVRRIGKRYGIGRVSVAKADWGSATYLAKYLDKKRFTTTTRIARWHSVGMFEAVHKNDIEVISPLNMRIREAQEAAGEARLPLGTYQRIRLEHYDLICENEKLPSLTHPRSGLTSSDPQLSLSEMDTVWPELAEHDSKNSGAHNSPPSSSLDGATSPSTNSANGATGTRNHKIYYLKPDTDCQFTADVTPV